MSARRAPAWILYLLLPAMLLSSCTRSGTDHDVLVFAGPGTEPDTLNPLLTQMSDTADLAILYMPVLLENDAHDHLIPEIATAVPTRSNGGISADGKTIIYHLRHGVVWQDGAPLTARDVAFTFNAIMNPRNDVASRDGYDRISSVRTEGPWTVVVRMKEPYSPIIAQFCNYPTYPILPAHVLARYADLNRVPFDALPIGAGPYKVIDWVRGDHIDFAANPLYWRGKPHIAHLEFRFIASPGTAAVELRTRELGALFNGDPSVYQELLGSGVHVIVSQMNDIHLLLLNQDDPVLKDVRVRRAIAFALQRHLIVEAVVHGLGDRVDADQPTFSWAHTDPKNAATYDPARSRALLTAAGWRVGTGGIRYKDGTPLALSLVGTDDVTAWHQLAVLLQSQLANVGIKASIKTYAAGTYFGAPSDGGILRGGRFQLGYDAVLLGVDPNDEAYYGCDQFAPIGENVVHWCDPVAYRAMKAAVATYDVRQRAEEYAIIQTHIAADVPFVALWQVRRMDAFSVPVIGFDPSPSGETFWNAWAWRLGGSSRN